MSQANQAYGKTLPVKFYDQVELISANFDAHLELVNEVRELYKDRVALEREYATKLQALAKKAAERKSKLELRLVLGSEPTKAWTEASLKQNTLNAAYGEMVESMLNTSQDHINVADALTTQVVEVLKVVERRNEDAQKKEMQFFHKLTTDRDRVYADRAKSKQKYDEECIEVDTNKQKQSRAQDDRHAERVSRQAEQQRNEMLNSKNLYIISTALANTAKAKYFDVDIPDLENVGASVQLDHAELTLFASAYVGITVDIYTYGLKWVSSEVLQSRLVGRFTKVLLHAQALQLSHLDVLKGRLTGVEASLNHVDPPKDQDLFIDFNVRPFSAPPDWDFEPCHSFYDTDAMITEPTPKVFLQNKLRRSQAKLQELGPLIDSKAREHEQLEKLVAAYTADKSLGNIDDITDNYLEASHQFTLYKTSETILNAEIDTILKAVEGDLGAQQPHTFKSSSFSIPTTCGYCKTSIWGLSKQGKTCKACNLSVHAKCELKVPADCQRASGMNRTESTLSTTSRHTSRASSNFREVTPIMEAATPSSFVHPSESEKEITYPTAKVIYDFVATSEFELSVSDGAVVHVLEPDDGSGWVKVADGHGADGLVPASYLDHQGTQSTDKSTRQQGSGKHVKAIYQYVANGPDELGLEEGEVIELSSGPTGGQHYGEGWWEGFNAKGDKGIFPSNYVEAV
ncbi:Protein BZZ1 [Marasmius crinis-equi]|uniref:Protein BZZ1 n=1 Tax=Marasmius crinis-equi TaxID=585013 RepID=A0ABR3G022_9AGAR